jgi:hypothetical protein
VNYNSSKMKGSKRPVKGIRNSKEKGKTNSAQPNPIRPSPTRVLAPSLWQAGPNCQRQLASALPAPSLPLSGGADLSAPTPSLARPLSPSIWWAHPVIVDRPFAHPLASPQTPPISPLRLPNLPLTCPTVDVPTSRFSWPPPHAPDPFWGHTTTHSLPSPSHATL